MKQPYLGKKIIELRKARGLTQAELVEKSGVAVRTLQRIEAGEVSPRLHTVKTLFKALDFDFYNSSKIESNKPGDKDNYNPVAVSDRRRRAYEYFIDLFNLKTNTMKKLSILSIPFVVICLLLLGLSNEAYAQRRLQKKLIGTWQICNSDSTIETNRYGTPDRQMYKIITKETFMAADISKKDKQTHGSFWGTYTLKKNEYTEFVQFANRNFRPIMGMMNTFEVTIKKDLMFLKGTNNPYTEIWKKVKD